MELLNSAGPSIHHKGIPLEIEPLSYDGPLHKMIQTVPPILQSTHFPSMATRMLHKIGDQLA